MVNMNDKKNSHFVFPSVEGVTDRNPPSKSGFFSKIKKIFNSEESAPQKSTQAYVLITCSKPTSQGDMEVEMTYEGDEDLVSYLVENASHFFQKN